MNPRSSRNPAASVLALLLKEAKRTGDDYQALLNAYICERFLYRLGLSSLRDRFVLKGALLLRIWSHQPYRATRDLDLLRRGNVTPEAIHADIEAICRAEVDPDGIEFDPSSIRSESVRLEDEYAGMRFKILVRCSSARGRSSPDRRWLACPGKSSSTLVAKGDPLVIPRIQGTSCEPTVEECLREVPAKVRQQPTPRHCIVWNGWYLLH